MVTERAMPKRPQQHRLEETSINSFSALAPENWSVSRPSEHDYGIDLVVELFSGDDATGMRFFVQLKATEGRESAVQVKVASLNYWLEQDTPVMIFRWSKALDRAWIMWAHHIEPPQSRTQSTVRVKFSDTDVWDEATHETIEREVRAARAIRRRAVRLPLPFTCTGSGTTIGVSAGSIVREVRRALRQYPAIITTTIDGPADVVIDLRVDQHQVRLGMRGTSPKILECKQFPKPGSPAEELDRIQMLARATLFVIAIQLHGIGCTREAAQLLLSIVDEPSVAHDDGLHAAVTVLALGGERRAAARLLDVARRVGADHAVLVASLVDDPTGEEEVIAGVLREWVQEDLAAGDLKSAAPIAYNVARRTLSTRPDLAVELLIQAAELDPSYRDRDYWNREIGGAAFLSGDFPTAVTHYQRAVELGDEDSSVRLGDALLHAGQYADSLELLRGAGDMVRHAEFRLKAWFLEPLIAEYTITAQIRDRFVAERLCDTDPLDTATARQALEHDLLCPQALWALGQALLDSGQEELGVQHLLAATLSEPANDQAWVFLLGAGEVLPERHDIMSDILLCARQFASADVLDRVWEIDPKLGRALESAFATLPSFEEPPTIIRATSFGSTAYSVIER
jgi:tetratricopeptide (TPR) repeat protein